jgi:hypothetical protein
VPEAIVEHQVFTPDLKDFASRIAQAAAFPALIREIPELRGTLVSHYLFLGDTSRVPLYATLLTLGLRRPKLTLLALVWWMLARLRVLRDGPLPPAQQLAWLPFEMAVDLSMASVLVVGSIQAGTLVL